MPNKNIDKVIPIDINEKIKKSYMEYAMSVIVGRALPDVRDGLKPVQRRIIYSMYETGITPEKPHKRVPLLWVMFWHAIIHMVMLLFMMLWCAWPRIFLTIIHLLTDMATSVP